MPMTIPRYDTVLVASAAKPITTPIDSGPDSMGMAIGVSEISSFVLASLRSAGVMRLLPVTMPQAVLATIRPPAIFRTGNEMPKRINTKRPKNRKTIRIVIT